MKKPSKLKIGFDLTLGGAFLALAATLHPYDAVSIFIAGIAALWIAGAAVDFDRHY